MNADILIVEDDIGIQAILARSLREKGYRVSCANTIPEARQLIQNQRPDLVLLDIQLPGGSGLELCRWIRSTCTMPIIFLSVLDDEQTIITALDSGGDDYVEKPFSLEVLHSRIRSQLRRANTQYVKPDIRQGFWLDSQRKILMHDDSEVHLSATEYRIVEFLMAQAGCLVTRNRLLEVIWDSRERYVEENTMTVTIGRLRRKINLFGSCPLRTVHGLGYRWEQEK